MGIAKQKYRKVIWLVRNIESDDICQNVTQADFGPDIFYPKVRILLES